MPIPPIRPMPGYSVPVDIMAGRAVRDRIRRKWERRRTETGGRSEAFFPPYPGYGGKDYVLRPEDIYTIPARDAFESKYGPVPAREARPRPREGMGRVHVRLVQPR